MATVSIIVPVYNAENYLERCVNSLVNQTYRNIEIILVDDGSKDSSGVICDRLSESDSRIKVLHCPNGGVSNARNRGIEIASGEFLSFVDSDDWLSLDSYEKLICSATTDNADLVYSDYVEVYENGSTPFISFPLGATHEETVNNMLLAGPRGGNPWNFLLVRESLIKSNGLLFPTHFKRGEDFWFAIRCFILAKKHSHSNCLYFYNCANAASATHNESVTLNPSYLSFLDECIYFMKARGCWDNHEEIMSWRILLEKTIWLTKPQYFHCYKNIHPEVNSFVDSCPFLGTGMKWMMKLVDNNMTGLASILSFINRIKNS